MFHLGRKFICWQGKQEKQEQEKKVKGKIKERKEEMEEMEALTGLKKTRLHLAQISMEIMYKKVDLKLICNNATEFGIQAVGHNNGN